MADVVPEQKSEGGHEDEAEAPDFAEGTDSSSDEEKENMDNVEIFEIREMNDEEYAKYLKQAIESNGFDVLRFPPGVGVGGGITHVELDEPYHGEIMVNLAKQALKEYNEKNENLEYEFVKLVKATCQCVAGFMYYITFNAKDTSNNTCQTFRTKVWHKLLNEGSEVQFCEII